MTPKTLLFYKAKSFIILYYCVLLLVWLARLFLCSCYCYENLGNSQKQPSEVHPALVQVLLNMWIVLVQNPGFIKNQSSMSKTWDIDNSACVYSFIALWSLWFSIWVVYLDIEARNAVEKQILIRQLWALRVNGFLTVLPCVESTDGRNRCCRLSCCSLKEMWIKYAAVHYQGCLPLWPQPWS